MPSRKKTKEYENRAHQAKAVLSLISEDRTTPRNIRRAAKEASEMLDLPEQSKLDKNSIVEISYEYWYDRKRPLKRAIINILRLITLFIVAGNLILSIIKFGSLTFWI